ncbi:dynamin family protein [Campylobacter sp. VBCF_06 NA8]|uniref:LeoA/HP0731 family dynamin-like GTPase n=1 Tax=Campylobacter sp. VBCF_06 NA8 TaxID=2983822 RepID=UPI0022EA0B64|nr:LeoA/HP0731 family dynamin-like GTPase [Campylobacter sp. VBCF_06 NA8]MDA3046148.1 dynamin family protein [Campylobacter sp. VBCF_06 NA8]
MNETLQEFGKQKSDALEVLQRLKKFLENGENLGIKIDENLKDKLKVAMSETENTKLKVCLIGGFSEGKTSIAAAWLGKLDKSTMKISEQESSDEVNVYNDDEVDIVDTPGLFGYKEKTNDRKEIEKYKDITKKYVSEANIILYVMNSKNPIKDSHSDDLKWLFRELSLLNRTVFVLSRFDEIADLEDENSYNNEFIIKQGNVISRLSEILNLNDKEKAEISVVAVSANPFDEGIEYWQKNYDEFMKISHIKNLQDNTKEKVIKNGGALALVNQTRKSIIKDILNTQVPKTNKAYEDAKANSKNLEIALKQISSELKSVKSKISRARINLKEFVGKYFTDIILQLNNTDLETFKEFVIREIGDKGINIEVKIKNKFEEETSSILTELEKVKTTYIEETSLFESTMLSAGKSGLNSLANSGVINAENIKLARDVVTSVAKFFNIDLVIKFKPWEAVKIASNLNKAIPFISAGIEAWETYSDYKKQQKFLEIKNDMTDDFNKKKAELINFIDSDDFVNNLFEIYPKLMSGVSNIQKELNELKEREVGFKAWKEQAEEIIDVEII